MDLKSLPYGKRSVEFKRRCLQEKGWVGTIDPTDGGLLMTVPPDQRAAYEKVRDGCEAEFLQEFPPPVLTEKDYKELYRQELVAMACLEREGYPPRSEPISEQAYVDAYLADEPPPWMAYDAYTGADLAGMEQKCPQPSIERG
ncbi:MAG: hypothetical protein V9G19_21575 [Tetrasphaera sp.]